MIYQSSTVFILNLTFIHVIRKTNSSDMSSEKRNSILFLCIPKETKWSGFLRAAFGSGSSALTKLRLNTLAHRRIATDYEYEYSLCISRVPTSNTQTDRLYLNFTIKFIHKCWPISQNGQKVLEMNIIIEHLSLQDLRIGYLTLL